MTDSRGCTSTSDTIRHHQTASDISRETLWKEREWSPEHLLCAPRMRSKDSPEKILWESEVFEFLMVSIWDSFTTTQQRLSNDSGSFGNPVLGIQTTPRVTPCGAAGIIGRSFGMAFPMAMEWQWNGNRALQCSVSSYLQKCQFDELKGNRSDSWQEQGWEKKRWNSDANSVPPWKQHGTDEWHHIIYMTISIKKHDLHILAQFGWSFHRMSPAGGR